MRLKKQDSLRNSDYTAVDVLSFLDLGSQGTANGQDRQKLIHFGDHVQQRDHHEEHLIGWERKVKEILQLSQGLDVIIDCVTVKRLSLQSICVADHPSLICELLLVLQDICIHLLSTELTDPEAVLLRSPVVVECPAILGKISQQNRHGVETEQEQSLGIHKDTLLQDRVLQEISNVTHLVFWETEGIIQ